MEVHLLKMRDASGEGSNNMFTINWNFTKMDFTEIVPEEFTPTTEAIGY